MSDGHKKLYIGCLDVNDWWKVYGTRTKAVTHWMPLPEPPKEEQHEKCIGAHERESIRKEDRRF